jgi:hypothetical protein
LFRIGGVPALPGLVGVAVAEGPDRIGRFSWIGVAILAVAGVLRAHLHLRAGILARSKSLGLFVHFAPRHLINHIVTVQLVILLLD